MRTRGRVSADHIAASTVVPFGILGATRPAAPEHLTPEQAAVWERIVKRMPVEWFPEETHDILADYCCAVVSLRVIAKAINELERKGLQPSKHQQYRALQRDHMMMSRMLSSTATKMRITQQSTVDATRKKGTTTPKSWTV